MFFLHTLLGKIPLEVGNLNFRSDIYKQNSNSATQCKLLNVNFNLLFFNMLIYLKFIFN